MFDLTNRVAVVTGASSGLGAQFADALAEQGAHVALLARRVDRLESHAAEIRKKGGRALPVACDVTDTADLKRALAAILKEFGTVDILVNNAGRSKGQPAENTPDEDWKAVVDLNLNALFFCCREFGREMIKRGYGRIINIASVYGAVGNLFSPTAAYHASKGGVINLTRALGAEWAKTGVTVNAIGPGFFASELTGAFVESENFLGNVEKYCPMGRIGHPKELNGALVYLASEESSYSTGSTIFVDGGWTAI